MSKRISRTILILAATAGLAASAGTASAATSSSATGNDNAPGGVVTKADDHRPAGAGHGRKVG